MTITTQHKEKWRKKKKKREGREEREREGERGKKLFALDSSLHSILINNRHLGSLFFSEQHLQQFFPSFVLLFLFTQNNKSIWTLNGSEWAVKWCCSISGTIKQQILLTFSSNKQIKSMGFYYDLCLITCLLSTVHSTILPAITKDWLIEFHQPVEPHVAKRIAKRYAMVSRGPVGNLTLK